MRELQRESTNLALSVSAFSKAVNQEYLTLSRNLYQQGDLFPYENAKNAVLEQVKKLAESSEFNPIQKRVIYTVGKAWTPHMAERNKPNGKKKGRPRKEVKSA